MSVSMMELVAEAARTLARNAQAEEGRSIRGFRQNTEQLTDRLISAMFPSYAAASLSRESALLEASELLIECLDRVLPPGRDPEAVAGALFAALPEVQRQLQTDLAAAYEGDPAAASVDEIILCYPAFPAIAAYRLAHVLYLEKVPLLPRMMTEYAHRTTGIDIHPGATIGDSFFIDHGTGVVIGETTTIGEHVKLYQHVTLGAKSFELGPDGNPVKGIKRHPDIGDRVVIYAGATILGGRTRIGSDGMDYKGFNIGVHEFGHNVEQTISLHDVANYFLAGVPNTAFTEALAFTFQGKDLELLGIPLDSNENTDNLKTLDLFWNCYEIMGVSLVDIQVWQWMYEHPNADAYELKDAVIGIAKQVWNQYYAPIFKVKDEPILAIYSHAIIDPLYLSAYPIGHIIDFQLENFLKGKNMGEEVTRIYKLGRLEPNLWMQRAVGEKVSVQTLIHHTEKAARELSGLPKNPNKSQNKSKTSSKKKSKK